MYLLQLKFGWYLFVIALALSELAALGLLIYLGKRRRARRLRSAGAALRGVESRRDREWVSREIERLCSGETPNEQLIRQMTAEDRALFEVSIIDALNNRTREGHHRLRSSLIKYGYDEQCSRRVMSQNLSDRVRATALLDLLRPKWRDTMADPEQRTRSGRLRRARATSHETGPLDVE